MRARCLVVFARVPRLGAVKTRLAKDIGEAQALDAYRCMLTSTLALRKGVQVDQAVLCLEGQDDQQECLRLASTYDFELALQVQGHLGARMQAACAGPLAAGSVVVLVGCDLPTLQAKDLNDAFDALATHDAVIAPTEDGGYGLVGLSRAIPDLFAEQCWGGAQVMGRSRLALRNASASWQELRTLWDVDELSGYLRWQASVKRPREEIF